MDWTLLSFYDVSLYIGMNVNLNSLAEVSDFLGCIGASSFDGVFTYLLIYSISSTLFLALVMALRVARL